MEEQAFTTPTGEAENAALWLADAQPSKRTAWFAAIALGLVFAASFMYTPAPVRPDGSYFTICLFKNSTGLPCPGCGLSHSFCALGKGDWSAAFAFHLLGPLLFLTFIFIFARALCVLTGWQRPVQALDQWVRQVKLFHLYFAAFIIYGLARIVIQLTS